jgi:hypothetical protein
VLTRWIHQQEKGKFSGDEVTTVFNDYTGCRQIELGDLLRSRRPNGSDTLNVDS